MIMTMRRIVFLGRKSFRIKGVVQKIDFDDNDDEEDSLPAGGKVSELRVLCRKWTSMIMTMRRRMKT